MKTIPINSASIKTIMLIVLYSLFFSFYAKPQIRFEASSAGLTNLFEDVNHKIGLWANSTFPNYPPFQISANFHIRQELSLNFPANPLFKIEITQDGLDNGSLSFLFRENNENIGIRQSGTSLHNYFYGKVIVGEQPNNLSSLDQYKFIVYGKGFFNSTIDLKDHITFIQNQDSHGAGITWQTLDLDDTFTFTNHNITTNSTSNPLILDPLSGVTTHGILQADQFKLLNGAGENKILLSDQNGNGIWSDASLINDQDWLVTVRNGDDIEPPTAGKKSLYFNERRYKYVGIGTDDPKSKLHVVDGNILISPSASKAPGSRNGSILFGEVIDKHTPLGEWGIEYYRDLERYPTGGLNFWKVASDANEGKNYCLFIRDDGNVGVNTKLPEDKFQINEGFEKLSIGSANSPILFDGTSYVGLNASRGKENWKISSNERNNGGAVIMGDVHGNIRFATIPSVENGNQEQDLNDDDIANKIKMIITGDGNVGVGTNNPKSKFHVVDGNIMISRSPSKASGNQNGSILFGEVITSECPNGEWGIGYDKTETDNSTGGLNFWKVATSGNSGADYCLYLKNNGNVGIGTSDPSAKFNVINTENPTGGLINSNENNHSVSETGLKVITGEDAQSFISKNKTVSQHQNKNKSILSPEDNLINTGILSSLSNNAALNGSIQGIFSNVENHSQCSGSINGIVSNVENTSQCNGSIFGIQINVNGLYGDQNTYGIYSSNNSPGDLNKRWSGYFKGGDVQLDQSRLIIGAAYYHRNFQINTDYLEGANSHTLFICPRDNNGIALTANGVSLKDDGDFVVQKKLIASDIQVNHRLLVGTSTFPADPDGTGKVAVDGKLYAREIEVNIDTWPDNVFSPDYQLKSLKEVENYILLNKHLPDVPTESQVKSEGLNLGEANALLLKKVEELTLYVIELKKEIQELQIKK